MSSKSPSIPSWLPPQLQLHSTLPVTSTVTLWSLIAAKISSNLRIILKHILPQTTSYVIIAMTLSVPSYILAESGLSFLGLGIQQPDASWGNMLKEAQEFTNILYRPWLLSPGFLIFIAVLSFNILGDAIRDILDPKSIKRGRND